MSRILALHALLLLWLIPAPVASADPGSWASVIETAEERFGPDGVEAARFLAEYAPARDAEIDPELVLENIEYALRARAEFPWSDELTDELFLNDVLPYASLDETRERWRPELFPIAADVVKDAKTFAEAAQALNRELFNRINVHYNTGRKAPNQSPSESIAQGRATCTGLSIILVDACRAVGVPARIAGVFEWHGKPGNHTWVEVWDGTSWRFTGADEYNAEGLDRAWFIGSAAKAIPGDARHGVWATSWRRTGNHFPMAWNAESRDVNAIDVSERYVPAPMSPRAIAVRHIRLWDGPAPNGERIEAAIRVLDDDGDLVGEGTTRAGRADLNDTFTVELDMKVRARVEVTARGQTRIEYLDEAVPNERTVDLIWPELSLDKASAERLVAERFEARRAEIAAQRTTELDSKAFKHGPHAMRILEKRFGDAPEGERSLWISMHGGGGAPTEVNDGQWRNQIRLYEPDEGYYLAPRAPTDTWNLWHQGHIDPLFDRIIETYVASRGVDPDRVYLMGYSAGGDGVYQLAPRMADRFAAASMMAGHPNESQPQGLRNLPFAIFMGANDAAYKRNEVAKQWGDRLGELQSEDPDGYDHMVKIYADKGHWMDRLDAESLPWMASKTRTAWPERVVWRQDDVLHTRFYWLSVEQEHARKDALITAWIDGQTINVETPDDLKSLTLRLRDELIDIDQPIRVVANGRKVYEDRTARTQQAIDDSLAKRLDPSTCATATIEVSW